MMSSFELQVAAGLPTGSPASLPAACLAVVPCNSNLHACLECMGRMLRCIANPDISGYCLIWMLEAPSEGPWDLSCLL